MEWLLPNVILIQICIQSVLTHANIRCMTLKNNLRVIRELIQPYRKIVHMWNWYFHASTTLFSLIRVPISTLPSIKCCILDGNWAICLAIQKVFWLHGILNFRCIGIGISVYTSSLLLETSFPRMLSRTLSFDFLQILNRKKDCNYFTHFIILFGPT